MEPLLFRAHYLLHRSQFEIRQGRQPENALFIIEKGCFSCQFSDARAETVRAGDFVFFPRERSFSREILEPIDFHLIYFKRNEADALSAQLPCGITVFADAARQNANLRFFRSLLNRTDDLAIRIKQHALNDVFFQYLLEAEQTRPLYGGKSISPAVLRTMDYLHKHASEAISLDALAKMANVSPSTLNRSFKAGVGVSPVSYLVKLRMRLARQLLTQSDASVSEIAEQCGYANVYYFSRAFKKECGCSPSEYRNSAPLV